MCASRRGKILSMSPMLLPLLLSSPLFSFNDDTFQFQNECDEQTLRVARKTFLLFTYLSLSLSLLLFLPSRAARRAVLAVRIEIN